MADVKRIDRDVLLHMGFTKCHVSEEKYDMSIGSCRLSLDQTGASWWATLYEYESERKACENVVDVPQLFAFVATIHSEWGVSRAQKRIQNALGIPQLMESLVDRLSDGIRGS